MHTRAARGTWQGEHPLAQAPLAAVLLGRAGRALGHHAAQRGAGGELGRDPCTCSEGECPNFDNDTFGKPLLQLSFLDYNTQEKPAAFQNCPPN